MLMALSSPHPRPESNEEAEEDDVRETEGEEAQCISCLLRHARSCVKRDKACFNQSAVRLYLIHV